MPLLKGEKLERRYRVFFDNDAIREVVEARTPNDAHPVDEEAVLDFVRASDEDHAGYIRSALRRLAGTNRR